MRVIQSEKFSSLKWGVGLLLMSCISPLLFAQEPSAPTQESIAKQLQVIQGKLDQSEQREKKILANQDKILEEVIKSRMWLLHRK